MKPVWIWRTSTDMRSFFHWSRCSESIGSSLPDRLKVTTAKHIPVWFSSSARPNWYNIVQNCWTDVAWCWMMMNEVCFPWNTVFNIVQHFLFSGVNKNGAFVWPSCSTLLNSRMPTKPTLRVLYPWWWFFVCICFARCRVSVEAKVWRTNKLSNLSKTKS